MPATVPHVTISEFLVMARTFKRTFKKPMPLGISYPRQIFSDEASGPLLDRIKSGANLTALTADYEFFTYAPLFIYGGLEHNPIQEWINLHNHKQVVYILPLPAPVVKMSAGAQWDQTLWLVEKEHWMDLAMHIGSMAFIDRNKKAFARPICQQLPIIDVIAMQHTDWPTTIHITTFGVDGNFACIAFHVDKGKNPVLNLPRLKRYTPLPETVKFSNAMFRFEKNPFNDTQKLPWAIADNPPQLKPTESTE
jgi:hypothetical protein